MPKLAVLNKEGKQKEWIDLPEDIFGDRVNTYVIHQAVVMYQHSLRQGTASTKERGAVSGGGKKPWRQKGTGQARAGSTRSPLWKGGGTVFGPVPRDYGYSVPKKIRIAALRESLNAKFQSQNLFCLDEIKDKLSKTKEFASILKNLKLQGRTIALLDGCDESIKLVTRNIPRFEILRTEDVNAYDIMQNKSLMITKTSFNKLLKRIKKA